jgi:ATP-dependent DNA helicase RecQ
LKQAIKVLEAARQSNERFGLKHLVDLIRGVKNDYITSYDQDKLPIFGTGKEDKEEFWSSVVRQTLLHGLLQKDIENIGTLKLSEKGKKFLDKPHDIEFTKDKDFESLIEDEASENVTVGKAYDEALFELLKNLRKKVARQKSLPPYVIFQDPSLEEMSTVYPTSKEELSRINGVGMGKVNKFGKPFLELIKNYVEENDIETASDVVIKSAVNKSKTKIYIIQQIDRKVDLQEIADAKGISYSELIEEIENICYSGTKLNLDYYIDHLMDEDRQEEVFDYFMNAETDAIDIALEELGEDDYDEEDLRLMRVKFLSDYAN